MRPIGKATNWRRAYACSVPSGLHLFWDPGNAGQGLRPQRMGQPEVAGEIPGIPLHTRSGQKRLIYRTMVTAEGPIADYAVHHREREISWSARPEIVTSIWLLRRSRRESVIQNCRRASARNTSEGWGSSHG